MKVPATEPLKFQARGIRFGDEQKNSLRIYVRNPRSSGGIYKPL